MDHFSGSRPDNAQSDEVAAAIAGLQEEFEQKLVTNVLPFVAFKESDARFQNYYLENPDRPFCKNYIDPKLSLVRRQFVGFSID